MTPLDLGRFTAMVLVVLFVLGFVVVIFERRIAKSRFLRIASSILGVAAMLNFGLMAFVTVAMVDPNRPLVWRLLGDVFNVSMFTLILGVLLFYFRRADRALYGAAEVGFAMATAGFIGWQADGGTLTRLLGLAGALYIIVRGLDNLDVGLKADRQTPFAAWIKRLIPRKSPEPVANAAQKAMADQTGKPSSADGS